jgi:hypothetical protein
MKYLITTICLVALSLAACSPAGQPTGTGDDETASPPVYVAIAGHIEDSPVYADCQSFPDFRARLLQFAETISETGAIMNLQIDYEFLEGVSRCEDEEMRASTGGKNIIEYLVTQYGFEIDPHQEGGWEEGKDNYADIRYLGGLLTPSMSDNVGGMLWDSPQQFSRLSQGEPGRIYSDFTWHPEILTLAVSEQHHHGDLNRDDMASGIWMPKGANENFWQHDPNGHMAYVGPGEHINWDDRPYQSTPQFVKTLCDKMREGLIDRDRMYTATIAVPQRTIFNSSRHQELLDILKQMAPLIESGQARYVTYSQAVDIWREEYGSQPNIFFREGMDNPALSPG